MRNAAALLPLLLVFSSTSFVHFCLIFKFSILPRYIAKLGFHLDFCWSIWAICGPNVSKKPGTLQIECLKLPMFGERLVCDFLHGPLVGFGRGGRICFPDLGVFETGVIGL